MCIHDMNLQRSGRPNGIGSVNLRSTHRLVQRYLRGGGGEEKVDQTDHGNEHGGVSGTPEKANIA